jgi:hypothetical protein
MSERWEQVAKDKALTARQYFQILRLAIERIDRKFIESSYEVAVYAKSEEVFRQAVKIAQALN